MTSYEVVFDSLLARLAALGEVIKLLIVDGSPVDRLLCIRVVHWQEGIVLLVTHPKSVLDDVPSLDRMHERLVRVLLHWIVYGFGSSRCQGLIVSERHFQTLGSENSFVSFFNNEFCLASAWAVLGVDFSSLDLSEIGSVTHKDLLVEFLLNLLLNLGVLRVQSLITLSNSVAEHSTSIVLLLLDVLIPCLSQLRENVVD